LAKSAGRNRQIRRSPECPGRNYLLSIDAFIRGVKRLNPVAIAPLGNNQYCSFPLDLLTCAPALPYCLKGDDVYKVMLPLEVGLLPLY